MFELIAGEHSPGAARYRTPLVMRRRDLDVTGVDDESFPAHVETGECECVTLRQAAYMMGIGRVATASRLRGWV